MLSIGHQIRNRLLLALPTASREGLSQYLDWVLLRPGQVLCSPGTPSKYAYFPVGSVVSLLCLTEDGGATEVATVGDEGVVEMPLLLGGESCAYRAVVRNGGYSYRCPGHLLGLEVDHSTALQRLLLRYAYSLLTQMAQTAVCNRYHSLFQQLCRWLLLSLDRSRSNEILMTQESIAQILGVRREGVTEAAGRLRSRRVIDYRRGAIVVVDRASLERSTCECYAVFTRTTRHASPEYRELATTRQPQSPSSFPLVTAHAAA